MAPARVLAVLGVALVLSACGDSSTTSGSSSPTTTAPGSTQAPGTTIAPSGPSTSLPGFATTPVSVPGTGPTALLTAVRAAHQEGFDRIVFEFSGQVPGYEVDYITPPAREDGSGNAIQIDGPAVLRVRMSPASGVDLSAAGARPTYTGPTRFRPDTTVVKELVRAGDFEAQLTWVAGLPTQAPFKVSTLSSPSRLVVDVAG